MTGAITNLTPTTVRALGGVPLERVGDLPPRFNILIFGDPGVGKTRLVASCDAVPEMRRVVMLDVDGGTTSAKKHYPNVQRLDIQNWQQILDIGIDLKNTYPGHGFQTVAIDTGTEAQKYDQAVVLAQAQKKARDAGETPPEVPGWREWNITTEHFRRMVRLYRDLPMNFIMTCHVKEYKDEQTGVTTLSPDLPGKLARQISGFFDIVLYMYTKKVIDPTDPDGKRKIDKRLLASAKTQRVMAKDRSDQLPAIFGNCTMDYIYNKVKGYTTTETENISDDD